MLDDELEIMEDGALTDAEQIGEETLIEDVAGDMDELLGEDAMENDMEHAYDSFYTRNEEDYDGFDSSYIVDEEISQEISDAFYSGGWHIDIAPDVDIWEDEIV